MGSKTKIKGAWIDAVGMTLTSRWTALFLYTPLTFYCINGKMMRDDAIMHFKDGIGCTKSFEIWGGIYKPFEPTPTPEQQALIDAKKEKDALVKQHRQEELERYRPSRKVPERAAINEGPFLP